MKSASLFLSLACSLSAVAVEKPADSEQDTFVPAVKQLSSYDMLRKKSPFEFDPPKPPSVVENDPFEGVSLAGYCGSGNTLTVYLLEGKEKKRLTVYGDGSPFKKRDDSGFRVIGINRGRSLKTTEVVLEKDGHQGTVRFEDETLRSNVATGGKVILDKNGKPIPRPPGGMKPTGIPVPPPVNPVQAKQGSQVFIPGMTNQAAPVQGGTAPAPGNGTPRPFVDPFTPQGNPLTQAPNAVPPPQNNSLVLPQNATGVQTQNSGNQNSGNKYGGGRRKVVLPAN
jgi:hypothetical protein